jgi:precorrin-6A synthase
MKKILIIGIGAGDPEYITMQAVNALNEVDVFFMMDKGPAKTKLIELRKEICRRYISGNSHRFVDATSPEWMRGAEDYFSTVDGLNRDKQALFERLIAEEMTDGECGAFLVWGDPTLYDSTIRIIEVIAQSGRHQLDYQVIPGISSIQALAARHRIILNRIGKSVHITTGRKLAEGAPEGVDDVVVVLDGDCAFKTIDDDAVDIFWGAYLGTEDEILISGKLRQRAEEIERTRAEAKQRKGWIMDTYLLRKTAR